MSDRHLNLFYNYRREGEFLENNLTRALIVTLSFLSQDLGVEFVSKILKKGNYTEEVELGEFDVALQGTMNIDYSLKSNNKILLTIASSNEICICG